MKVQRSGNWIEVDWHDRERRWSFPDPETSMPGECSGAFDYLLRTCPTTRDATRKLADMRRALKLARSK
jgi:hypothetical protein